MISRRLPGEKNREAGRSRCRDLPARASRANGIRDASGLVLAGEVIVNPRPSVGRADYRFLPPVNREGLTRVDDPGVTRTLEQK